ncbi:MAG: MFS transporter [Propionibacteriaceae bacterium]
MSQKYPGDLPRPSSSPAPSRRQHFITLAGAGVGNMLEWFDWNVYATFSMYFAATIFNPKDETAAFLSSLAVFAVGFVARPFGGLVFGRYADRVGRKKALMLAVILASLGSLIIACCPTYAQVGWGAAVVLLVARLLQGFAHGGELPSAQTFLAEKAPKEHRGLWSSAVYFTGTSGTVLGMLLGLICQTTLTQHELRAWAWRIPFALGAVLGLIAFWIRVNISETEAFTTAKRSGRTQRHAFLTTVRANWRQLLATVGLTCGGTVFFYVWSVATPGYATKTLHFAPRQALWASIIGNLVLIAMLPFWGWLSDQIGRRPVLLIADIGALLGFIPAHMLIHDRFWQLALAISLMLGVFSANVAVSPATYAELFPTNVRASGMGLPYALTVALCGGTAPYLMSALAAHRGWFQGWVAVLLIVTICTTIAIPETKGKDLRH